LKISSLLKFVERYAKRRFTRLHAKKTIRLGMARLRLTFFTHSSENPCHKKLSRSGAVFRRLYASRPQEQLATNQRLYVSSLTRMSFWLHKLSKVLLSSFEARLKCCQFRSWNNFR